MSPVSTTLSLSQMQISIAKKQLDSAEQQGQQALALIEAAQPPGQAPANVAAGVGTQVNVVA